MKHWGGGELKAKQHAHGSFMEEVRRGPSLLPGISETSPVHCRVSLEQLQWQNSDIMTRVTNRAAQTGQTGGLAHLGCRCQQTAADFGYGVEREPPYGQERTGRGHRKWTTSDISACMNRNLNCARHILSEFTSIEETTLSLEFECLPAFLSARSPSHPFHPYTPLFPAWIVLLRMHEGSKGISPREHVFPWCHRHTGTVLHVTLVTVIKARVWELIRVATSSKRW